MESVPRRLLRPVQPIEYYLSDLLSVFEQVIFVGVDELAITHNDLPAHNHGMHVPRTGAAKKDGRPLIAQAIM